MKHDEAKSEEQRAKSLWGAVPAKVLAEHDAGDLTLKAFGGWEPIAAGKGVAA